MFAIIVPYRDKSELKTIFLNEVPKYINKYHGNIDFKLIISEQKDNKLFNICLARNYGALWAIKNFPNITHFIFNDIDSIPVLNVDYVSPENIISFLNFGSVKIKKEDFCYINGYNPLFFGWGGEDHDFNNRIKTFLNFKESNYSSEDYHINGKFNNCYVTKRDGSIFKDLDCPVPDSNRDLKLDKNELWRSQTENTKNNQLISHFYLSNTEEKQEWMKGFGLNLINLRNDNNKLDLNNCIINLEYDTTCLDPKAIEIRNSLEIACKL